MKPIFDITPFSIVDFEGKISAVVWFCGCNMRCVYCYNTKIVSATNGKFGADDLYFAIKKLTSLCWFLSPTFGGQFKNQGFKIYLF